MDYTNGSGHNYTEAMRRLSWTNPVDVPAIGQKSSTASKPQGYFFDAFRDAVQQIGRTVLVLFPLAAPIPLTRAWCVWEMYCTLDTGAEMSTSIKEAARRSAVRSGLLAPEESDAPFDDVFKKPLNG